MAYTKQYGVTITADGDDIETGFTKEQQEFDNVYSVATSIATWYAGTTAPASPFTGLMWLDTTGGNYTLKRYTGSTWATIPLGGSGVNVPQRQCVLVGSVDGSTYLPNAIIAGSGLALNLVATATPFIMSFMAGFDSTGGAVDYIGAFTADVTGAWTSLPGNSTLYLFVDRATDGTLTRSYSSYAPVYSESAPGSPSTGQYWGDLINWKMKYWNGASWDEKQVVFVGECVTGASSVSNVRQYPYLQNIIIKPTSIEGCYKNLLITNGATPNSQVAVTVDEIVLKDSSKRAYVASTVSLTVSTGSSGANGLDTGSVANSTWYSVWVIYNSYTNTVAGLLSTSSTAPTMPTGYSYKARVGWVKTYSDGTLLRTKQVNDEAQYVVTGSTNTAAMPIIAAGAQGSISTPTYVAVSVSAFVPPTAWKIGIVIGQAGGGALIAPNNNYGAYSSATNQPPVMSAQPNVGMHGWIMLESTNIYYACDTAGRNAYVLGWRDNP
jgi:hypothetical protein